MTTPTRRFRPWQVIFYGFMGLLLVAAVDLAMQEVYRRYLQPATPVVPSPTPTRAPTRTPSPRPRPTLIPTIVPVPTLSPTVSPTQTVSPTPQSFVDQQIEEAIQRITFQQLLLKAAMELLRTEDYLASGEMKQVERELAAVSATLDQASRLADESLHGTMADLQRDLSHLREDLYLRPERLQEGLRRLWQRIDVLIGE